VIGILLKTAKHLKKGNKMVTKPKKCDIIQIVAQAESLKKYSLGGVYSENYKERIFISINHRFNEYICTQLGAGRYNTNKSYFSNCSRYG